MAFITRSNDISYIELSNANVFLNDNGNTSDEDDLYDDALAEAYKTLFKVD